jgi:hypothetical protein
MIRPDKHDDALRAIHRLLVYARKMAAEKAPHEDLFAVLDVAELLPMLFLEPTDKTEFFRQMISDNKNPGFVAALDAFDRHPLRRRE